MARCSGCSGDRCSCVIRNGENVTVTGAGTPTNPFVISAAAGGGGAVPAGSLVMFGGTAVPAGWVMANGAALNRVAFATLFAAIGTAFGAGDGSTTFNVPNLEQRFPVGAVGAGVWALGATGGAAAVNLTTAHMPLHSHTMAHTHDMSHGHSASSASGGAHQHDYQLGHNEIGGSNWSFSDPGGFGQRAFNTGTLYTTEPVLGHTHTITVNNFNGSTGASSAANTGNAGQADPTDVPTVPPYLALNFIIKT